MKKSEILKSILDRRPELIEYAFLLILSMHVKRIDEIIERWVALG